MKEGYVILERAAHRVLEASQKNLLAKRGAIWGRLLAMKAFGNPTPRLGGFSLFDNWLKLSFNEKTRSIAGTARRIIQRGYYRPVSKKRRKKIEKMP
jgi:coenzyme F420 hydrogenase subunit beta